MKTIVSIQEISELEIKPSEMVNQWKGLVEKELSTFFPDRNSWIKVGCFGCKTPNEVFAFEQFGIKYNECKSCGSLFAPERPSEKDLWRWYRESDSSKYWRNELLPASAEARMEKITRPRAEWILDGIAEYLPNVKKLVDVSSYGGALVELIQTGCNSISDVTLAGVTADLETVSLPGIKAQPTMMTELSGLENADVITAIDIFDRAADLEQMVNSMQRLLTPGGLLFSTLPVASGFEIQTLWDRSPSIIPPDKLNLPSVKYLSNVFSSPGWEILELSTPGMFDVETVYKEMKKEPEIQWPRAVRALVEDSDQTTRTSLVELLQSIRRTSFARLVVRKNK